MKDTIEFEYNFSASRLVFGVTICMAGAVGLGYLASTNTAGLSFRHVVSFGSEATTVIYWTIAGVFAALAVVVLNALISGATTRIYRIRLTPTEFSAPKWSWFVASHRIGATPVSPFRGHAAG